MNTVGNCTKESRLRSRADQRSARILVASDRFLRSLVVRIAAMEAANVVSITGGSLL
jgi:hypothetical protein